jgi:hypothetical protein
VAGRAGGPRIRNRPIAAAAASLLVLMALAGAADAGAAARTPPDASLPLPGNSVTQPPGALALPFVSVSPVAGPPGTVVTVTGRRFPGLMGLHLSWSTGVQFTPLTPVVTADAGTFTAQALVVPGDAIYGPRYLIVSVPVPSLSVLNGPPSYRELARTSFLVTERPAQPPVPEMVRKLWGYLPFFFRR